METVRSEGLAEDDTSWGSRGMLLMESVEVVPVDSISVARREMRSSKSANLEWFVVIQNKFSGPSREHYFSSSFMNSMVVDSSLIEGYTSFCIPVPIKQRRWK